MWRPALVSQTSPLHRAPGSTSDAARMPLKHFDDPIVMLRINFKAVVSLRKLMFLSAVHCGDGDA
jgi:hypothetical protein